MQHATLAQCFRPTSLYCFIHLNFMTILALSIAETRRLADGFSVLYAENVLAFAENTGHDLRMRCGDYGHQIYP